MNDVTLVIAAPADGAIAEVRRLLTVWMRAGLVRPFLWWHGCSEAGHLVSNTGGRAPELMLEAIGAEPYATIRLVSLTAVVNGQTEDMAGVAADIEDVITARLGAAQRLARVNLIVPVSGARGLPAHLLNSRWDVNLVVADEDRPTPLQTSPEVRHPGRFVPHTAGALASVAGLWPGMSAGPFDGLHEGGQQDARVRVVRSYVRLLRCDNLVDEVTGQILDLRENRQWVADAVDALPVADSGLVVSKAVDQFFGGPGARLSRRPAVAPPQKPPRVLTPWAAFLELWRFLAAVGRRTPADIAGYVKDRALMRFEEFAQGVVFGEGSNAQVKIGTRTLLAEGDNGERISASGAEFADALLSWLGSHPPVPALGTEWRSLHRLSFGLIDAGALPDGVEEPEERSRRLVVADIEQIAPDPFEAPFELPPTATTSDAEPLAPAGPGTPATPPTPPALAGPLESPASAELSLATEPPGPTRPPSPTRSPGARETPVTHVAPCDPAVAAQVAGILAPGTPEAERFDDWLTKRRLSLLWRVGERISTDGAAAEAALVDALASITRPRPDSTVDRRETSRMYRALIVIAVLAGAFVALSAVLWVKEVVSLRAGATIVALTLVGWLLLSWSVFYPFAKRQFRLANVLLWRFNEDEAARFVAEREADELIRLAAAYREYLDWATIIGAVLHRPGGATARTPSDVDHAELCLPDAVRLGIAETDLRRRRRLAAIVGRRHFHRGWASGLLIEVTAASMAALKFEKGAAEDDPEPEPEVDTRARQWLLDDLVSGATRSFGDRVRYDVAQNVGVQPLHELFSGISTAKESTPERFLTAIWAQPPSSVPGSFSWPLWRSGQAPMDDSQYVWKPPAVSPPALLTAVDVQPVVETDSTVRLLWTARLDVSGPGRWSDLQIFEVHGFAATEIASSSLDGAG